MFTNDELKQYLETSSSVNSEAFVFAEWNMNIAENISTIGNYRYRPTATSGDDDFIYANIANSFNQNDCDNDIKFWCGATDADVKIDGGLDNDDQPIAFVQPNEKERLLYSLEDCFKRFRPRSGINKLRYFEDKYTSYYNKNYSDRPRFYMASRNDVFKYWTSYREESGVQRGIANKPVGGLYYIDDAAPFVVYKETIPANRIVVKMQTNVGDVDLGPFLENGSQSLDPFYGYANQTTPNTWSIQVLRGNDWVDVISFNPLSTRENGDPIIGSDGYVEIAYGIIVPEQYRDSIVFAGKYPLESLLPKVTATNNAYFVQQNENEAGTVYVWNGTSYESFIPEYGWYLKDESSHDQSLVTEFVNPEYFINNVGDTQYKEFEYIRGLRVVAKTMNKQNSTFDLIELSPRLATDITERTVSFNFNKSASDLGVSGMPVGQLLATNGSAEIFDFDDSFNKNNINSILSSFVNNNIQVKLFEKIYDYSDGSAKAYVVPLKTMYADGFPESKSTDRSVTLALRDLFFYLESNNASDILLENATLSQAVSMVLDGIGFSNYRFYFTDDEDEPTIPYFFIKPDTSVAQIIQDLAIATQTAAFFDEDNNLVFMSRNYIMPSEEQRETDIVLSGSLDQSKNGIVENETTNNKVSNIVDLSSKNNEIFNDGKIVYQEKYIEKTYGSLKEANYVNQDQNWIYKPALLWEVAGTEPLRSISGDSNTSSSYSLSAVPLNSDLSDVEPTVVNGQLINNILDFGEGAYWVSRYNGYFYANGEIIKYDAIEYSVSGIGNVWISSLSEYQGYFSQIKFNGKIYPTGRVRIYSEPFYEEIDGITVMKNGAVRKHGRAQFGTSIAYHNAGLAPYWSDTTANAPVGGIEMDSRYLFSTFENKPLSGVYNQSQIEFDVLISTKDSANINDIATDGVSWISVSSDGSFLKSDDAETWEVVVDTDFDESFSFETIAYGDGNWIAAGSQLVDDNNTAVMAYSTDGDSWTQIDVDFDSNGITKIVYDDETWMVVGRNGLIAATSNDPTVPENWDVKTQHLDYTIYGDNKSLVLSSTSQETYTVKRFEKESGTNYVVVVIKNHGLSNNQEIKLSTTGTLPNTLVAGTSYYVKKKNKDSFYLMTEEDGSNILCSSIGSGTHTVEAQSAIFTIKKHKLKTNDVVRVVAVGDLTEELSEDTDYFVTVKDKNKVYLSTSKGGAFIAYVSGDSSSLHKVERFVDGKLNSVAYGNNTWVVVGNGGILSVSSDTNTWVAYNTKVKNANILDVLYESGTWLIVGSSGKTAKTTSPASYSSWSTINTKLGKDIKSIAYGNGVWVAGGSDGKISRSTNLTKWKSKKAQIGKANVNKLIYTDYWLAVGNKSNISKSEDDGLTWVNKSQHNVSELSFETVVPHGFTPFDPVYLTINDQSDPEINVVIESGSPAVLVSKNHKLNDNDRIIFPEGSDLPTGLEEGTVYYVAKVDNNSFNLAIIADNTPINTSGDDTSTTYKIVSAESNRKYYVTPKNITSTTFTLAETRDKARSADTLLGAGDYSGQNTISLSTDPEDITVSAIENVAGNVQITIPELSDINVNDRIFFHGILSNTSKPIPGGIVKYAPYYIQSVLGSNEYLISEQYDGEAATYTTVFFEGEESILSVGETVYATRNITDDVINRTLLSPSTIGFTAGNLLEVTGGDGELVSPTRVSAIRYATRVKKNVTISIDSPAVISCEAHGLFDLDTITFDTTGTLPEGIEINTEYLVNRIDDDSFSIIDKVSLENIETKDGPNPDAEVPDDSEDSTINYREQSGTHSFIKSFNDTNKIILNREVGTSLPQYSVSVEEVLVDAEDGETETSNYYTNSAYENEVTAIEELEVTNDGKAGYSATNIDIAKSGTRNGIIKNFFTRSSFSETDTNKFLSTQTGTVQSSALVFNGPSFEFGNATSKEPIDFVSYIHKPLDNKFTHFGTRMRIIGKLTQEDKEQIVANSTTYFLNPNAELDEKFSIYGGSAGIGLMNNPETNVGYFFEIIALSQSNVAEYANDVGLFNVVFYKTVRKVPNEGEASVTDSSKAIPIKLWQGVTSIIADDGTLVGQFRTANDEQPSVYDVSVEYEDMDDNTRKFYLMINNNVIGIVNDTDPLPAYNNMSLFVRGGTRAMFENVYAISNNYSQNTVSQLDAPVNNVFGTDSINVSEAFRKYAMSGAVQATYLSGISSGDANKYSIYYEEFGTIMRECAYFNIRYDKAYPALYSTISKTFNKMKGYTVSGFTPTAYGAEFLVFNNTDSTLNLDETSGNYLRIQGVTFTQSSDKELSVDDYFDRVSNFADPDISQDGTIVSPIRSEQDYLSIKNSRLTYGRKEFSISSPYIQSQDEANRLMEWIISKIMKPRKSVGLEIFAMPTIQLGDIVEIDYSSNDSIEQISLDSSRFVVYNIEYSRDPEGPSMNIFLSEVI